MKASCLIGMLKFSADNPMIFLRDHIGGRIRVLARSGEWLATIAPNFCPEGNVLRFTDSAENEFRGSWGLIATVLSVYQQTGGDWAQVYEANDLALDWE